MISSTAPYGDLIRLDPSNLSGEEILERVPLGTTAAGGGMDEESLARLLFRFPGSLPVGAVDAAYSDPVPICRELRTKAGRVDALYINELGRLIVAEFKLWRNPDARRVVIGQILDYTKELASWTYTDLQREVSKALGRKGNIPFDLVRERAPELDEVQFVDSVTRHLKRGEFLLLIIGDGIREDVEHIVQFVQSYSGLHFNLALVEAALYRDTRDRIIVHPRVLARTEVVHRIVVEGSVVEDKPAEEEDGGAAPYTNEPENVRFWNAVLEDYRFSDVTVELPEGRRGPQVYVKVRRSGYSDWGLSFVGFLERGASTIGCYLTCRKDTQPGVDVFEELEATLDEFRGELGDDLEQWDRRGRPRIGFRRSTQFPLPPAGTASGEFEDAVAWMRDSLERLVSTVHPRLQRLISARAQCPQVRRRDRGRNLRTPDASRDCAVASLPGEVAGPNFVWWIIEHGIRRSTSGYESRLGMVRIGRLRGRRMRSCGGILCVRRQPGWPVGRAGTLGR